MPGLPHSLIRHYDSIGWIPTIRGCLSLDLTNNAKCILGDVDKYSVRFKQFYGLKSAHYLMATSLDTVNVTKVGDIYERSFRYIFTGSINDKKDTQKFLNDYGLSDDKPLKTYIKDEGLLIGRLAIVVEVGHKLSSLEVALLKGLKDLTKLNKDYLYEFHVNAASMKCLEEFREKMYERWTLLVDTARQIEEEKEINRPIYRFDVALTRDGILLLKDVTSDEWKQNYAATGSPDDYTQNIPIHRLFKNAMNYVKCLFHSNYHHNEDHNTYLPVSNLHPILKDCDEIDTVNKYVRKLFSCSDKLNLDKVFKHQLDAFLVPVIRLKRSDFSSYTIDPKGIILYAKAFIAVFESNNLVSKHHSRYSMIYCNILEREIENMAGEKHKLKAYFPAFLVIILPILQLLSMIIVSKDETSLSILGFSINLFYFTTAILLFSCGYILHIIKRASILSRSFKSRKMFNNNVLLVYGNSNLIGNSGKFSFFYKLYLAINSFKMQCGATILLLKSFFLSCILLVSLLIAIGILISLLTTNKEWGIDLIGFWQR